MIEFNGYISGASKKKWIQKNQILGAKLLGISSLLVLPSIIMFAANVRNWFLVALCSLSLIIIPLLAFIPQREKNKHAMLPKNIIIDDDYIVCKTDKGGETKCVSDVKLVNNYEEFYEMVFPFGKVSNNFICQKDLLVKGSLEEFEILFASKIQDNR